MKIILEDKDLENIDVILSLEVKKFGKSGHIPISKKYLGRKVKVFILENDK